MAQSPHIVTPFMMPADEPVAMDVDATHTREEFTCQMCGRCFKCGLTEHTKREGHHERDLCDYCHKAGHHEVVCFEKFIKRFKAQKGATMVEREALEDEFEDELSEGFEEIMAMSTSITLTQLKVQQKILAEKIAALKADF